MKKIIACLSLLISLLLIWITGISQVTIGSSLPANNSAILDLQSNSKGFLPPRMSTPQRIGIASPAAGLVVFDTDVSQLYLFDGIQWQLLSGNSMANSIRPPQQFQPPAEQKKNNGFFGVDVAITDNYAVVGAPSADLGANPSTGAVYVYKKGDFGGWSEVAKLYASDPQLNSFFGASVAIAGNYIVVGAPLYNVTSTSNAGKIYVFVKGVGDVWTSQAGFTNPTGFAANDQFGYDVAISTTPSAGPTIIVGAPYVEGSGSDRGAAYTFRFNGTSWNFQEAFAPLDLANTDKFGYEVNIDGDYCAVGAPEQNNGATLDVGAVYVFVYAGPLILWGQQQKLPGYTTNSRFGYSMSLKGDLIAVAAPFGLAGGPITNPVYLYQRTGTTWNFIDEVFMNYYQGFDESNQFGISVSIDNDKILVGMPAGYVTHTGSITGDYLPAYVIVFKKTGNNFLFYKVINDNEPFNASTVFGNSVSMKNGYYVIGIPGKNSYTGAIAFGYIE